MGSRTDHPRQRAFSSSETMGFAVIGRMFQGNFYLGAIFFFSVIVKQSWKSLFIWHMDLSALVLLENSKT